MRVTPNVALSCLAPFLAFSSPGVAQGLQSTIDSSPNAVIELPCGTLDGGGTLELRNTTLTATCGPVTVLANRIRSSGRATIVPTNGPVLLAPRTEEPDEMIGAVLITVHGVESCSGGPTSTAALVVEGLDDFRYTRHIKFNWGCIGVTRAALKNCASDLVGDDWLGCAPRELKYLVDNCRSVLGPDVAINILSHSQGTVVTLAALVNGERPDERMRIDNWVLMGSPIHRDCAIANFDDAADQVSGNIVNLWSELDGVVGPIGGIGGRDDNNRCGTYFCQDDPDEPCWSSCRVPQWDLWDIQVPNVCHSESNPFCARGWWESIDEWIGDYPIVIDSLSFCRLPKVLDDRQICTFRQLRNHARDCPFCDDAGCSGLFDLGSCDEEDACHNCNADDCNLKDPPACYDVPFDERGWGCFGRPLPCSSDDGACADVEAMWRGSRGPGQVRNLGASNVEVRPVYDIECEPLPPIIECPDPWRLLSPSTDCARIDFPRSEPSLGLLRGIEARYP